ncbi:hypothetical protein FPV67DRAFT_1453527 [Lyophyllum atratum]|nr:hypothetical protein FPV67DRAFT_1453527 [Lyophyllum atratum]
MPPASKTQVKKSRSGDRDESCHEISTCMLAMINSYLGTSRQRMKWMTLGNDLVSHQARIMNWPLSMPLPMLRQFPQKIHSNIAVQLAKYFREDPRAGPKKVVQWIRPQVRLEMSAVSVRRWFHFEIEDIAGHIFCNALTHSLKIEDITTRVLVAAEIEDITTRTTMEKGRSLEKNFFFGNKDPGDPVTLITVFICMSVDGSSLAIVNLQEPIAVDNCAWQLPICQQRHWTNDRSSMSTTYLFVFFNAHDKKEQQWSDEDHSQWMGNTLHNVARPPQQGRRSQCQSGESTYFSWTTWLLPGMRPKRKGLQIRTQTSVTLSPSFSSQMECRSEESTIGKQELSAMLNRRRLLQGHASNVEGARGLETQGGSLDAVQLRILKTGWQGNDYRKTLDGSQLKEWQEERIEKRLREFMPVPYVG